MPAPCPTPGLGMSPCPKRHRIQTSSGLWENSSLEQPVLPIAGGARAQAAHQKEQGEIAGV